VTATVDERGREVETTGDLRAMPCPECGGDGGFSEPVGMDPFTGHIRERVWECRACGGTGETDVELEPIALEDLLAMGGTEAADG
jgi:C4-type Zn-finger protein